QAEAGFEVGRLLEVRPLRFPSRLGPEGWTPPRRLAMRVPPGGPTSVAFWIWGLRLDLRVGLAGALAGHGDLDAGIPLEGGHHLPAPFLLHAAIDRERALGRSDRERAHREHEHRCRACAEGEPTQ